MQTAVTKKSSWALALILLCIAAAIAWLTGMPGPRTPQRPRNLILVSIDTLRADALGSGGQSLPASPTLDRIARQGVTFSQCISSAPHTDPSHATIFTGLFQRSHGVYDHTRRLAPDATTLAEILAGHGYATAALANSPKFHRSIGLDQGFEHYELVAPYETEPWRDRVLDYLRTPPRQPLFLFLHVLDPHAPYNPAHPLSEAFHDPYTGPFFGHLGRLKRSHGGATAAAYQQIGIVRAWYASEVLEVDTALGQVLARLRELRLLEDSVLILLSDHGEEFLDHGGMEHSHSLFDELLRVPLLIQAPGWPQGVVVNAQVRTVDLLPTALQLLGLPPSGSVPGVPLSPDLRAETGPAVSERGWNAEVAWRTQGEKLRYDFRNGMVGGYTDLRVDPAERENRVKYAYAHVEELVEQVERWRASTPEAAAGESSLDAATREQIEALGYVGQ